MRAPACLVAIADQGSLTKQRPQLRPSVQQIIYEQTQRSGLEEFFEFCRTLEARSATCA